MSLPTPNTHTHKSLRKWLFCSAPLTLLRLCWLKLRQACLLESPLRLGTDLPRVAGKAGLFHLVAIGGKAFRVE